MRHIWNYCAERWPAFRISTAFTAMTVGPSAGPAPGPAGPAVPAGASGLPRPAGPQRRLGGRQRRGRAQTPGGNKLAVATRALSIATRGLIPALVAAWMFAAPARAASLPGGGIVSVTVTGPTTATAIGSVNDGGLTTSVAVVYDLATSSWCRTNGANGKPAYSAGGGVVTGIHPYPQAFHALLSRLTPRSVYCLAVRATNSLGTVTGPPYKRFTSGAPDAESLSLTSTSSTTATLYGEVNPASQSTAYQVRYDLASSTWCSSNGTTGTPTDSTALQTLPYTDGTLHMVWVSIAGLTSGTSYCATITATNATASTSGSILGFTLDVPGVLNNNVAVTGATTATINGTVNASGQTNLNYAAIYDLANSTWCATNGSTPDATTVHDVGTPFPYTDSVFHPVSVNLNAYGGTALAPNTEYCVTLEAGTTQAVPIYFTTTAAGMSLPPTVATDSASGVGTGSATVSGTVNPNGEAATYHFDYGTSTNYGSQAPAPPDPTAGSATTAQTESTTLTGLSPNTVYHYRIEATNGSGTSYGADQTFTTTGAGTSPPSGTSPSPIVATGSAINVGSGSATVSATVNANGEAATYRFDYGTSANYTSQTISEPISSTTAEFVDAGLTGLSPNTVYHYRIEATDAWGTSYGADRTFTTTG